MSIQHKIEQNKGIKNDLWGIHLKKLKKKQNSSNIHMSTRDFKSFKLKMKLED